MKTIKVKSLLKIPLFLLLVVGVCGGVILLSSASDPAKASKPDFPPHKQPESTVYMTTKISPESIMAIYKALGHPLSGKIAVKLSTGEAGDTYYLNPNLIKDLVHSVNGTIVECNTAYPGKRTNTAIHMQVAKDHGFTDIAPVDIMDAEGSIALPFPQGAHLHEDYVGSHLANYDSILVLSHFKGHAMGGFGGALKNISIGIASSNGKMWIHTAGFTKDTSNFMLAVTANHNAFIESMAEAAGAVMKKYEGKMVYINVMNNLSIDCDCDSNPSKPEMGDIGILASTDPVALDKACVDQIYKYDAKQSAALRHRIESRNGTLILDHAEALGIGSENYKLVPIDG